MYDAVLTATHLIRCDIPSRPMALAQDDALTPLMALEHLKAIHSLHNIWLHPSSLYAQPAMRAALLDEAHAIRAAKGDDLIFIEYSNPAFPLPDEVVTIRPRFGSFADGRIYVIHFPNPRWRFEGMSAQEMAQAIGDIARVLDIKHIGATPGATGLDLMRHSFTGHKWQGALDYVCAPQEAARYASADLYWMRSIIEPGATIWAYDANSAYLACASSGDFGIGAPASTETFQPKLPGFYYIEGTPGAVFDGHAMPSPFTETYQPTISGWYAEPLIRFALDHAWHLKIHGGVYWPKEQKHRMLFDWSSQLWAARMATQGTTRTMIKDVMRAGIGRLAHWRENTRVYRPDWRALIIAECRARRLRHIEKLAQQGYTPFAIHTDALYFASDTPIPIALADTLGAYKDAGQYPLTPRMRAGDGDLNTILQEMKQEGAHLA